MRSLRALIHKVLETQVSSFLKPHVVIECLFYQIIHLTLELKELEGELVWVLQVLLILDNLGAFQQDVRVHLVDDVDQGRRGSVENMVHHAQLVDLVLSEHVLASSVLLGESFRLLFNCLLEKDVHNL